MNIPVNPEKDPVIPNQPSGKSAVGRLIKMMFLCSPFFCFGGLMSADALLAWRGGNPVAYLGSDPLYRPGTFPQTTDSKELGIGIVLIIAGFGLAFFLSRFRCKTGGLWIDKCWWAALAVPLLIALFLGAGIDGAVLWIVLATLISLGFSFLRTEAVSEKWFWVSIVAIALYIFIGLMFRWEIRQPHWFTANHEVKTIEGEKLLIRSRYR
jgi:hypothetical protein